jgi:hypothetical protein
MESWQVFDEMHSVGKLLLNCVEHIFNWPINRVVGSTVDKTMASNNDHLRNDWVAVRDLDCPLGNIGAVEEFPAQYHQLE